MKRLHALLVSLVAIALVAGPIGIPAQASASSAPGASASATAKAKASGTRPGYVYLHSAVDGFSRLAYTEALEDETQFAEWSSLLYDQALIAEGALPADPGAFARRIAALMARS